MHLLQLAQPSITVKLGDGRVAKVPKFTLQDAMNWGQEIMDQQTEAATAEMNDIRKREFLSFYPPVPPTLREIRFKWMQTPDGVKRVLTTCMMRAAISGKDGAALPQITSLDLGLMISSNEMNVLESLANALADRQADEPSHTQKGEAPADGDDDGGADPLTK